MKRAKQLYEQRKRRQWFVPARRYAKKLSKSWGAALTSASSDSRILEIGHYESVRFVETLIGGTDK